MRRATVALAFVISTLLLIACGGGDNSSPTSTPAETTTTLPNATATESMLGTPGAFASYDNPAFKVKLRYPVGWIPDPRSLPYDNCGGKPETYRDPRGREHGYFQVTAAGAPLLNLDEVATTKVSHKHKPYGANPQVVSLTVDGRQARLILPDAVSAPREAIATLIVPFAPPPIVLRAPPLGEAADSYNYLVVNAHPDFIRSIADSVRLNEELDLSGTLYLFCGTPIPALSP